MNKVILMGRIVRDPDVRYSKGDKPIAIARYTLAINRNRKNAGDQEVDYINCVCLGKNAEVAEKYFYKGIRLVISGKIQSGSYINPEGRKIYTTTVLAEEQQFAESKYASFTKEEMDNMMSEYVDVDKEELPFF